MKTAGEKAEDSPSVRRIPYAGADDRPEGFLSVRGVCPHISVMQIYKGAFPFLCMILITILAICVWPDLVMGPVRSMMGSVH